MCRIKNLKKINTELIFLTNDKFALEACNWLIKKNDFLYEFNTFIKDTGY